MAMATRDTETATARADGPIEKMPVPDQVTRLPSPLAADIGGDLTDFSSVGWGRVVTVVVAGTLLSVAAALLVDSVNFPGMDNEQLARALTVNIGLPTVLAMPMLAFLMTKLRELAIAKRHLTKLASTDSLTAVLNRGAFTMIVDEYLSKVRSAQLPSDGTLLVVDVDHFKIINDTLGHQQGDSALRLIAGAITKAVRPVDLVGRIGGEEFGVFLPRLTAAEADSVAERIRASVENVALPWPAHDRRLSVSVGGASFTSYTPFEELFRSADQRMYIAKRAGRNRVVMPPLAA
jgi:diguanylate cyclase (GGDEF)-like protein